MRMFDEEKQEENFVLPSGDIPMDISIRDVTGEGSFAWREDLSSDEIDDLKQLFRSLTDWKLPHLRVNNYFAGAIFVVAVMSVFGFDLLWMTCVQIWSMLTRGYIIFGLIIISLLLTSFLMLYTLIKRITEKTQDRD
jgi:hypothetical protein